MNTPVYLSRPAVTSALGSGLQTHIDALLNPNAANPLVFSDRWVNGKTYAFGAVGETLRPLPHDLPPQHASRNNQLLWHALAQIESDIHAAVVRYGSHRIAVVIGTSTSGADENIPLFEHVARGGGWADKPFKYFQNTMSAPAGFVAEAYGLHGLRYAVLALGDSSYDNFCQFGQAIDGWLASGGGQRLFACIKADSADDFEMNAALAAWRKQLAAAFGLDAAQLARWQPEQPSEAGGWHDWTLAAKTRLNPGSAGSPVWLLELTAPAGASLTWEAGDLAQIAPPADAKNPRDYSIASIPQSGSLQLLVRRQNRADGSPGLCSAWLTEELQAGQTLPVRLRANAGFHLGGNAERALILIGNGVGLAGLLAHLHAREAAGQHRNWLIFGERNAAHDWLCHEQIARWQASGHLPRVDTAFSRDSAPGAPKTYVQTVLAREAATLRQWMDEGAALYVCGSLSGMAAGVDAVLRQTLGSERVDALLAERRYCRDVY